jgi:asparagine synthetase B (glutamine-hydrolysing)
MRCSLPARRVWRLLESRLDCGFGHRRPSILDLSDRAAQLMIGTDGNTIVIFDGRRAELEAAGMRSRSSSDTEALLHLYAPRLASQTRKAALAAPTLPR